jgi:hypothetical protein
VLIGATKLPCPQQLLALEERIGEVGKGLSKQVLATLPTFTYDSSVSVLGDPMYAYLHAHAPPHTHTHDTR